MTQFSEWAKTATNYFCRLNGCGAGSKLLGMELFSRWAGVEWETKTALEKGPTFLTEWWAKEEGPPQPPTPTVGGKEQLHFSSHPPAAACFVWGRSSWLKVEAHVSLVQARDCPLMVVVCIHDTQGGSSSCPHCVGLPWGWNAPPLPTVSPLGLFLVAWMACLPLQMSFTKDIWGDMIRHSPRLHWNKRRLPCNAICVEVFSRLDREQKRMVFSQAPPRACCYRYAAHCKTLQYIFRSGV